MSFVIRLLLSATLILPLFSLKAQQEAVTLTGQLTNCQQDTLYLFTLDGVSLRPQGAIPLTQLEGSKGFTVQMPGLPKGFYLIGGGQKQNTRMLILGGEPSVVMTGSCPTLAQASVASDVNLLYSQMLQQSQQLGQEFQQALRQYQTAQSRGQNLEPIVQSMARIDSQKLALLNQAYASDSLVGAAIGLQTYLSYPVNGEEYPSEGQYFANTYFRFVDWTNPVLDYIPSLHDAVRNYARTLSGVGLTAQQQIAYGNNTLTQIPEGTSRYKSSLLGFVAGFQGNNTDAFVHFAKRYLNEYPGDNPAIAQQLQSQISEVERMLIGALAPEISLPTPEGDTLSLSDLRGQVVLIDFWASWCRPCRMENPNVVRMYNRLHGKGFEIYGVSLDRTKANWEQAITSDGLTWHHVSDLKYWSSVAAQTYGVHSIPYTVVVDREGRIAAKGLRGAALEQKVEELLGE